MNYFLLAGVIGLALALGYVVGRTAEAVRRERRRIDDAADTHNRLLERRVYEGSYRKGLLIFGANAEYKRVTSGEKSYIQSMLDTGSDYTHYLTLLTPEECVAAGIAVPDLTDIGALYDKLQRERRNRGE